MKQEESIEFIYFFKVTLENWLLYDDIWKSDGDSNMDFLGQYNFIVKEKLLFNASQDWLGHDFSEEIKMARVIARELAL